ncbi:MAG TPA: GNAT family N-acetyltransferase [Jiangellaceae bacterium]|nr:GNAT family N-acetyltransferase [Jiangellaceae bacterium]
MSVLAQPLTDGAVSVRPLAPRDSDAFVAGSKDEQVRRFGHLPVAEYTEQIFLDQLHGVIADGLRDGSLAVLAIADADTDEFLGSITLFGVDLTRRTAETGFWLTPAARGRGAARRAVELVAGWAAQRGIRVLVARADEANVSSTSVLERAGFDLVEGPAEQTAPSGQTFVGLTYSRSTNTND